MGTPIGEPLQYLLAVLATAPTGCTSWPYGHTKGYGRITLDGKLRFVHRVVCEWYYGPAPKESMPCRHLCGNGHLGCFTPSHLRWGTTQENATDRIGHGRSFGGSHNPNARLTDEQVAEIRQRYREAGGRYNRTGVNQVTLAEEYGVNQKHISLILRNRAWKD